MDRKASDVQRRSWDQAAFARKAEQRRQAELISTGERQRAQKAAASNSDQHQPSSKSWKPGASSSSERKAWLQPREYSLNLDSRYGSTAIVSDVRDKKSGFFCELCDVLLKDSGSFLSHINGRNHQKQLGMSMKIKRDTLEDVKQVLKWEREKRNEGSLQGAIRKPWEIDRSKLAEKRRRRSELILGTIGTHPKFCSQPEHDGDLVPNVPAEDPDQT